MAFDEYQFLRYFIPGSIFIIYTAALVFPLLNTFVFCFFVHHPDAVVAIVGGVFAAGLAFGYLIYTIYDTLIYNHLAMNKKTRPLLRYFSNHVDNWSSFSEAKQKMFVELLHTTGANLEECKTFYSIGRGFWSHFNARLVCGLLVPTSSASALAFLIFSDYLLGNTFLSYTQTQTSLYIPIILAIVITSVILLSGADRPFREATCLEYLFIKRRIAIDPNFLTCCAIADVKWNFDVHSKEDCDDGKDSKRK